MKFWKTREWLSIAFLLICTAACPAEAITPAAATSTPPILSDVPQFYPSRLTCENSQAKRRFHFMSFLLSESDPDEIRELLLHIHAGYPGMGVFA